MNTKTKSAISAFTCAFDISVNKKSLQKPSGYYISRVSTNGKDIYNAFSQVGQAMRTSIASK